MLRPLNVPEASPQSLSEEVEPILTKLLPLVELWQKNLLSSAEMAGLYILTYLQLRPPYALALAPHRVPVKADQNLPMNSQAVLQTLCALEDLPPGTLDISPRIRQKLPAGSTLLTLFSFYSLRTIPLPVNRTLVNWMLNSWPLRLISYIPKPVELLREQSEGGRCVTITLAREQLGQFILGKRDPLDFLLHDLHHAEKFFGDPYSYQAQVGFFRQILKAVKGGFFADFIKQDPLFGKELEYVFADMNSYCGHLLKCLKAICLRYFLRREGLGPQDPINHQTRKEYEDYFAALCELWDMEKEEKEAAIRMNSPSFRPESDFFCLEKHFLRHGHGHNQNDIQKDEEGRRFTQ